MAVITGLSGNEIWCLGHKGYRPGEIVVGNSVCSLGLLGGVSAGLKTLFGGEVAQITDAIHTGRQNAYTRLVEEARKHGAAGVTGVTSELKSFHSNVEFLSVGSGLHGAATGGRDELDFTTSSDGQALYCLLDAGYAPMRFVFGNVAYSVGVTGGLFGGLKSLARGEVREFSDVFNATRHLALERMAREARSAGANAVVGVTVEVMPFQGIHEMIMIGTAARHPALPSGHDQSPVTSDLTCEEMWSLAAMGYAPLKLVMGTAVYSLGVIGNVTAAFKALGRGEIPELTSLIYDAREHALDLIRREAQALGADDVVGVKTFIQGFNDSSLIEFLAVGTAVRKMEGIQPQSDALPAQAILRDRDTWIGR